MHSLPASRAVAFAFAVALLGSTASAEPSYRSGEVIVKLRASGPAAVAECADKLTREGRSLRSASALGSDSLDRLHAELGVLSVRAIFRQPDARPFSVQRRALRARLAGAGRLAVPEEAIPDLSHVYVVRLGDGVSVKRAVDAYARDPHVEFAQPNYLVKSDGLLDDPFLSSSGSWGQGYEDLWGLHRIRAPEAWRQSLGEGVVVAVVDSGIDYEHPDIVDNLWVHPGEDLNRNGVADTSDLNGIDDDGNGFVDDLRGFNFIGSIDADGDGRYDGPEDLADPDPYDELGHGTHVAGTAVAVGGNGIGVSGVAPAARLMPLKIFPREGPGDTASAYRAVLYAAENGAHVINASFSCGRRCPSNPIAEDVVRAVHAMGVLHVTSAGNKEDDVLFYSPERLRESVVVAAVNYRDGASGFSNFGWLVDVAAPGGGRVVGGVDILSLRATETDASPNLAVGEGYDRKSGTSMATPHVVGLAALLVARWPDASADQIRALLRAGVADLGAPGHDRRFGAGRIDAALALSLPLPPSIRGEIQSPAPGSALAPDSEEIAILGSASGADLASYELAVGVGANPEEWLVLQEGSGTGDAPSAELGRFRVADFPNGSYVLRLVLTSRDGRQQSEFLPFSVDRNVPTPISQPGPDAGEPAVSGELVIWQSKRGEATPGEEPPESEDLDLFMSDLETGAQHRIAGGAFDQRLASIDGRLVAWEERIAFDESRNLACRLDRPTGRCDARLLVGGEGTRAAPSVSEGLVVWGEQSRESRDVYLCEPTSDGCAATTPVIHPSSKWSPVIDGLRMVWMDARVAPPDIFTCELDPVTRSCTGTRLETGRLAAANPTVSGELVAFEHLTLTPVGLDLGLALCHIDSSPKHCDVVDLMAPAPDAAPAVSGERLVWQAKSGGGDFDIYFCEFDRGSGACPVQRLTHHPATQRRPAIDGTQVVWEDDRDGLFRIFGYELPSLDPIADRTIDEGAPLRLRVVAHDPAGEGITLGVEAFAGESPEALGATLRDAGRGRGVIRWKPGFDQAGRYAWTISATTKGGLKSARTVWIDVLDRNRAPRARAGHDRFAPLRRDIALDGCASFDPERAPLEFSWRDRSGRELGRTCRVDVRVSGFLPRLERYELEVSDGVNSARDFVHVLWLPPIVFEILAGLTRQLPTL